MNGVFLPREVIARTCLMAAVVAFFAAIVLSALAGGAPLLVGFLILALLWKARHHRPRLPQGTAHGQARWCTEEEAADAGLFHGQGLFLGRWAGPQPSRLEATRRLFALPWGRSAEAVRQFLQAFAQKR